MYLLIICTLYQGTGLGGEKAASGSYSVNMGGGGRIAVFASSTSDSIKYSAIGSINSGSGTIIIVDSSESKEMLICDNGGNNAPNNSTPIIGIGEGIITRLTADTLFDSTKTFSPYVKGHKILIGNVSNPMYAVKVAAVVENGLIIDTTDGNLFTKGYVGDRYIGIYMFDTIKVTGGARVTIPGKVFYNSLILNNGTFTSYDGLQTGFLLLPGTREKYNENYGLENAENCRTIEPILKDDFDLSFKEMYCISRKPLSIAELSDPVNVFVEADSISDAENNVIEVASAGINDYSEKLPGKPACKAGDPIYTYDLLNRVTSMISPAGVTSYEYDSSSGRLSKIITPEGKEFKYHYDKGQLKEIDLPNGITSSYTFDVNGSLSDLHYRKEDNSTVQRFQYNYDKNGMRTSMTDNDGTHDYAYDALYQITRATHPSVQNPVAELVETEQFQYDEVGNWLKDNRVHNELNQLIEDDSCFYQYDFEGNMTRKIIKSTDDTTEFKWDIENKLVEVKKKGLLVQYEYDALGRRVTKKIDDCITKFSYDGENLMLEMNDSDSVVANYTFGPGIDNPLAMHRNDKNYYYLKDGLGSVTELTNSTGNVVKEYRYSVFGKIQESGDTALWNPFTYTAREWEKELGIYFYRARYFDPEMGRFLGEDPFRFGAGDKNFYRYVLNCPMFFIDPLGLQCGPGNGIIEWAVPENPLGYDFTEPCEKHDSDYAKKGKSKGECDDEFRKNMKDKCNGDPICEAVADVYYAAVDKFGDQAYHNAQTGGKRYIVHNEMFAPDITGSK